MKNDRDDQCQINELLDYIGKFLAHIDSDSASRITFECWQDESVDVKVPPSTIGDLALVSGACVLFSGCTVLLLYCLIYITPKIWHHLDHLTANVILLLLVFIVNAVTVVILAICSVLMGWGNCKIIGNLIRQRHSDN